MLAPNRHSLRVTRLALVVGIAIGAMASTAPANAGGLCGKGGLIRGSVGKACDKRIEKPITTPAARAAAVATAAAIGTKFGGPTGGAIGAMTGHCVNQAFAGRRDCQ